MFRKIATVIVALIAALSLTAIAFAEEIAISVTQYGILNDTIGNPRLIVKITLPDSLSDSILVFAEISFGITPEYSTDSILQLNCMRITTEWSPNNVGWSSPWTHSGGDFDTLITPAMFATTEVGAQTAYFDITEIVRDWLRNAAPNRGLIFIAPEGLTSEFTIAQIPELPNNAIASVKIVTQ